MITPQRKFHRIIWLLLAPLLLALLLFAARPGPAPYPANAEIPGAENQAQPTGILP